MLVEDQPFIALDIEGVLEENGYSDIVSITTCKETLLWLHDNVSLMAIIDPRVSDGICSDVVRHLADRQIPFVVYSGQPEPLVDKEPAFGVGQHLLKPAMPEDLIAAVRWAIGQICP
ncbi:MAG: response regulator [Rhizobiaceae bacterium]|nr:response regulator [Rhizobiaceae bacterium]